MKAMQYTAFGGSEVITRNELTKPEINTADDVLIQVKTASINPMDMKIRSGHMQQVFPVTLPFTPGLDVAGIVVGVGEGVSKFKIGDEVVAVSMGNAYSEYTIANQHLSIHKPAELSFEQASALVVGIGTAHSVLYTEGKLEKGQKLLVQGAAGAVGAVMVQMAKELGVQVYATASGSGVDLLKSLGADEVFDYKTQDVSELVKDIDLVADCAGGENQAKLFKVLKPGGKLLSIAAMPSPELAQAHEVEAKFVMSKYASAILEPGFQLAKAGKIKAHVSKTFPLEEAASAQDYLSAGGVNGKVVLVVS